MFNAILPLLFSLLSRAYAAPLTAQKADGPIGLHVGGGIVGFLVLVLDVIVWSTYSPPDCTSSKPGGCKMNVGFS